MKHLKKYVLFESSSRSQSDEKEEDIKDICLELEDEGFSVTFNSHIDIMEVRIYNGGNDFQYGKVSEVVERLKEYIGDSLIGIDILGNEETNFESGWHGISIRVPFENNTIVRGVSLEYTKKRPW